jgi:hypothetical protein
VYINRQQAHSDKAKPAPPHLEHTWLKIGLPIKYTIAFLKMKTSLTA